MKKLSNCSIALLLILITAGCNNNSEKETVSADSYSGPPYTVQLVEYVNEKLPDLHSFTQAVYNDKIIMIGGRTNGLHAATYAFDQSHANTNIYVVDTKNWTNPASWDVYNMPDSKISFANKGQFRANNAQFFTNDSVLYIVGGLLGGTATTGTSTQPYITAINLPALVNMVMKNATMPANSIRQVRDSGLAITGGELRIMSNTVYLVFGWNFFAATPPAGDQYSHQIRSFTYKDDGQNFSISAITVCKTCWDGKIGPDTAGNFRRRDGSLSDMIDPADGSEALVYYSGVFKSGNTNFDSPVWISKDAAAEQPFVMRSNVYTCMVVPAYSKVNKTSYATLLGGMRNALYNGGPITKPTLLTEANAPLTKPDLTAFTSIPYSNQFTTIMVDAKHNFSQYILPDSFPNTKTAVTLPASTAPAAVFPLVTLPAGTATYNGSESELIWTLKSDLMRNGVIDYDNFIKANPNGASIGYLYGGIQSALLNVFGPNAAHFSVASNRIFAVKIVPIKK